MLTDFVTAGSSSTSSDDFDKLFVVLQVIVIASAEAGQGTAYPRAVTLLSDVARRSSVFSASWAISTLRSVADASGAVRVLAEIAENAGDARATAAIESLGKMNRPDADARLGQLCENLGRIREASARSSLVRLRNARGLSCGAD